MVRNALSVDVEDWFQVGAFEDVIDRADWDSLELRVEGNTDRLLSLFDEAGVKATFFVLGWIAERQPALVRRIVSAGHEVASHGWAHDRVFRFDAKSFLQDIDRTRKTLEDAGGEVVSGYRAPSFSIDGRTPWAHEILARQGYRYSSSVAPVVHDHYGWPEAPRFAYRPVAGEEFVELPVTTARLAGRTLAAGGGGFLRILPYRFSRWALRQANALGQPGILYFHPWEIDPGQPRLRDARLRSRLRHYTNLAGMEAKLSRLLRDFEWTRVDAVAEAVRKTL